jgi:glycosyltransferase involved in cell wall biosynthesis
MRVLVSTYWFPPSLGGLETACLILCHGLVERGHEVTVVTMTPAAPGQEDNYPFKVIRRPGLLEQMRLVREHDVLWQHCISLRMPGLFTSRTPKIFAHHVPPPKHAGLKRLLCKTGINMYVSQMMQDAIGLPGVVIPNSYDEKTFRIMPGVPRDRDFAYVGRLVREKGVDVLVDALARLKDNRFTATIIGLGPEEENLKAQVRAAGIEDRVTFAGMVRGEALAQLLNRHRVLVVPSRWEEPFGIVALEGAACGCVVVGTESGGLVEAIGRCGPIVPKDDPQALANVLNRLARDTDYRASFTAHAPTHLERFTQKELMDSTERLLKIAVGTHPGLHGQATRAASV